MHLLEKYFGVLAILLLPVLYLVITPGFYLVLYVWKKHHFEKRKIQPANATGRQITLEVLYGLSSLAIFCLAGFFIWLLQKRGWSLIYFDPLKYSFVYLVFSVVVMIVFHDLYFYWTHRLLHLEGWYQKIHAVHHLSTNPSPFSSLSFHPVEAFIQALALPLIVVIIPVHPFALFIFLCFMVYKNVKGHAGFDFSSPASRKGKWNQWQNLSLHHNLHHSDTRVNYGLYFTFWDRLMKTFRGKK